jgi:hypothetical protein
MEPGRTKTVTADEHKRKAAINDAVRYRTANARTARAQREQRDRFGGAAFACDRAKGWRPQEDSRVGGSLR